MQVISKTQQNDLLGRVSDAGLDPADFGRQCVSESYRGEVFLLTHRPTTSRFSVSRTDPAFWVQFWPNHRSTKDTARPGSWAGVLAICDEWLRDVKRDHDAPDLWEEAAKAPRVQPDMAAHPELLQPFTEAERKQLETSLGEVEEFILQAGPPDPGRTSAIRGRFAYLRGAVARGLAKIDWWNIFVSQIFSMVTEGLLAPGTYGAVMGHARTALDAVLHFAASRLPSP